MKAKQFYVMSDQGLEGTFASMKNAILYARELVDKLGIQAYVRAESCQSY